MIGLAKAAAEIQADVPAGPFVDDRRRWRRLERQVGRSRRLDRRTGSEQRACEEKFFHRTIPRFVARYANDRKLTL